MAAKKKECGLLKPPKININVDCNTLETMQSDEFPVEMIFLSKVKLNCLIQPVSISHSCLLLNWSSKIQIPIFGYRNLFSLILSYMRREEASSLSINAE